MKIKDLKTGDIFSVTSMPQWGIMMKSKYRATGKTIFVSLTGNRWSHDENTVLDNELDCVKEDAVSTILNRLKPGLAHNLK